jgi:hypothetical protein
LAETPLNSSRARVGITPAWLVDVKKSGHPVERRKHDQYVGLDRRKHDDDFAERMTCGVRTWSPGPAERSPFIKSRLPK